MVDSTTDDLNAASALDGTEEFYAVQGAADRKVTSAQIKTFATAGFSSGLTIGTTTITSGTTLRLLYDNGGVVGETAGITFDSGTTNLTLTGNQLNVPNNWGLVSAGSIAFGADGSTGRGLYLGSGGFAIRNTSVIAWSSTTNSYDSTDTYLSRPAAATVQQGQADAAAPVAQTLTVQSVVAGTSNTAGADWTIAGSKGTGTGAGGSILFKTTTAGGSGTSQNSLFTAASVHHDGYLTVNPQVAPYYMLFMDSVRCFGTSTPNNLYFGTVGPVIDVNSGGSTSGSIYLPGVVGFQSSAALDGQNVDTIIRRGGVATLQYGAADAAAPVAQTLTVQSVVAGTSNTAGTDFTISGSKGTGTGAGGSIVFKTAPLGGSGTSQNALTTHLTLNSVGTLTGDVNNATSGTMAFAFGNSALTGLPGLEYKPRNGTSTLKILIGNSGGGLEISDYNDQPLLSLSKTVFVGCWTILGTGTAATIGDLGPGTDNQLSIGDATHNVKAIHAYTVKYKATAFASVPTPIEGMVVAITDSTTVVWGATITGGGGNHVLGYYNGTNWTVIGK